jgi:hypothetical protein
MGCSPHRGHQTSLEAGQLPCRRAAKTQRLCWDVQAENWKMEWIGANCVLQHASSLESGWSDVPTPDGSPYVVVPEEPLRFFRLRDAGSQ